MVQLHIEADHSVLSDGAQGAVTLATSPRSLAARHWPGGRPSPLQLERAIDDVENAIEQAQWGHADRGLLCAADSLRQVLPPPFNPPATFSRDEVEAAFSDLVAASHAVGLEVPPASTDPSAGESAAALLLVREVMHHLGFQAFSTGPMRH